MSRENQEARARNQDVERRAEIEKRERSKTKTKSGDFELRKSRKFYKLMKKLLLAVTALFICIGVKAQTNTDSLAYQAERTKINSMLAVRSQKFGEYDQSVGKHTGIFGLQTKKDIRRSNDILMNIVRTDDNIFKELKILLEYRAFEQTQVQSKTVEFQQSNLGYMTTINKLRAQVEALKTTAAREQKLAARDQQWIIVLIVVLATSILMLLRRLTLHKA